MKNNPEIRVQKESIRFFDETIDGKSKSKAYSLFDSSLLDTIEVGTIKAILQTALTDKINDREMFIKGIDYSYYYEQENDIYGDER